MPSQVKTINFFTPVYASRNGREHGQEKLSWLGRIVEPYFDLGQKNYRVVSDAAHGSSVTVEKASKMKSWMNSAMRVATTALKVLSYLTIVLPLMMLFAKMAYRAENYFVVLDKHQREVELAEFMDGIQVDAFVLDKAIDELNFELHKSLGESCSIIDELEKWQNMISAYPEQSHAYEDEIAFIENAACKLRDKVRCGNAVKAMLFNQGLIKKLRPDELNEYNTKVDKFFTKFQEELGAKRSENGNWQITLDLFDRALKKADTKKVKLPYRGIPNLGASCYMNSLLQVLMANLEFKRRIKEGDIPEYQKIQEAVDKIDPELFAGWKTMDIETLKASLESLNDHVLEVNLTEYIRVRNMVEKFSRFIDCYDGKKDLKKPAENIRQALYDDGAIPKGALEQQNDASEIALRLLDILGASLPLQIKKMAEPATGHHETEEVQPAPMIQIDLHGKDKFFQTIIDEYFVPKDQGSDTDSWEISEDVEVNSWKEKYSISGEPPQYIQIHLKRFFQKDYKSPWEKINTPILFPNFEVDMTETFEAKSEGEVKYRVKSAVIHRGSLKSGHYWSVIEKDGKWYKCDDTSVYEIENPQEELGKGYIYFLERI